MSAGTVSFHDAPESGQPWTRTTGRPSPPTHERIAPISRQIWEDKYRLKAADGTPIDRTIEDTWRRVARALAAVEERPELWEERFYAALEDFAFLPAGRILSGAGTERRVTLFNCFVMGDIPDDLGGIFAHLREAALTMQQGGGIGYDFSGLRPKGALVRGVGADASGPLSFMDVWDAMCRTIMSAGSRRGAMMATDLAAEDQRPGRVGLDRRHEGVGDEDRQVEHPQPRGVLLAESAIAGFGARRCRQQPDALVIADGLDVHPAVLGKLPD